VGDAVPGSPVYETVDGPYETPHPYNSLQLPPPAVSTAYSTLQKQGTATTAAGTVGMPDYGEPRYEAMTAVHEPGLGAAPQPGTYATLNNGGARLDAGAEQAPLSYSTLQKPAPGGSAAYSTLAETSSTDLGPGEQARYDTLSGTGGQQEGNIYM
jgi:hypothetical protein